MGQLQQNDPVIGPLYKQAQVKMRSAPASAECNKGMYYLQYGVLFHKLDPGFQIIVPQKVMELVLTLGQVIRENIRPRQEFYYVSIRQV